MANRSQKSKKDKAIQMATSNKEKSLKEPKVPKAPKIIKKPKTFVYQNIGELLGMKDEEKVEVVEDVKPKKLSPFDFIGAITFTKQNLIIDEETEKQYNAFIVNRGLSNSMDTVIYAAEMNSRPHLDNAMQFQFLLNTVPKRKRYDKWIKEEKIDDLDLIKEYYGYGNRKALAALEILTAKQVDYIRDRLNKGGK